MSAPYADHEAEVERLAGRYGPVSRERVTLHLSRLIRAVDARPKRQAEVVFAILRPSGRVLLHTKSFYPAGAWRLLSGSLEQGEGIERALSREVAEETSLQTRIARFLAVIDYEVVVPHARRDFRSYLFLLDEVGGELRNADPGEQVSAFREIAPQELPAVADALEALKSSPDPEAAAWADWGRFRAIVHRVAWRGMQQGGSAAMPAERGATGATGNQVTL